MMVSQSIIRLTSISRHNLSTLMIIPTTKFHQLSKCKSDGKCEMTLQGKPGKVAWKNLQTSGRNVNATYIFIQVLC